MKPNFSRLIPFALLLAAMLAAVPAAPVYAAPVITSIVPNEVVNNVSTTITINGSGFSAGSVVVLLDSSAIPTTVQNDAVVTATVPAGLSVGPHTITISNGIDPDVSCSCLTAVAPTPIPPTLTPTATTVPLPFVRPQFVVRTSRATKEVQYRKEFTLKVVLENLGQATAYSAQAVFTSSDLIPTNTGGVAVLGVVPYDDEVGVNQTFYVSAETYSKTFIAVDLTVTYYDDKANSYSDKFTLSVPVTGGGVTSGVVYPTATPTGVKSSQLVITNYTASIDPLQPGEQFALNLTVQNVGNVNAQRITMIVGGGSSGSSGSGTPQPGGVSGGSGDFANFAPVGASNVQSLGDLAPGESIRANQNLIVNVNTNPGAYAVRISFSYLDAKSEVVNDDQVITLLVYSLPKVDVSFYRPLDPFSVGQPGALPIQVVNLGKRLSVLGNMKVSANDGFIENGTSLVGSLDSGGYFTLDSFFTPERSGPQSLEITIEYVDDFNQPRTITKTLDIEVMEGFIEPTPDPAMGEGQVIDGFPVQAEETALQKLWRFVLGLLGLDSSAPSGGGGGGGGPEEPQFEEPIRPVLPSGKGG
ncbi:MAG TPA: IPT/TIG domain-containing protein [Anaerolineales bacterium]|nr:IPT/TIG domain-containing protein [Anaerolineales bacterium]